MGLVGLQLLGAIQWPWWLVLAPLYIIPAIEIATWVGEEYE